MVVAIHTYKYFCIYTYVYVLLDNLHLCIIYIYIYIYIFTYIDICTRGMTLCTCDCCEEVQNIMAALKERVEVGEQRCGMCMWWVFGLTLFPMCMLIGKTRGQGRWGNHVLRNIDCKI